MTTVLYMAQTVNGMVADMHDDTAFVSEAGWNFYKEVVANSQVVIMGRRTFEVMEKEDSLSYLEGKMVVVLTSNPQDSGKENVFMTGDSPNDIIKNLREQGFTEIFISGGGITNAGFLQAGLVDQLVLDIEPKLLGQGIPLCAPTDCQIDLQLERSEEFGTGGVRLFYAVQRDS